MATTVGSSIGTKTTFSSEEKQERNEERIRHLKGQSRTRKVCHWCEKKQEPGIKPFQACAKCKEVIYCSKECQVASWPLHKAPCKGSVEGRKQMEGNPELIQRVGVFRKWHNTNNDLLRCAFICALNLGHNPTAATTHALIISVSLKPDHASQPPGAKYTIINGCTLTDAELRKRLSGKGVSGDEQVDAMELSAAFLRKKGGLGLARFVLMEREMKLIDFVSIVLPDQKTAKLIQEKHNWRDDWVEKLRVALP